MKKLTKGKIGIIALIVIILILLALFVIFFLMPMFNEDKYGDRLVELENVEIATKTKDEISKILTDTNLFSDSSVTINGRTVNISATANAGVAASGAKENAVKVLDAFSEEEKSLYDIQIFLTNNNPVEGEFPYIGYKSRNSETIVWSNN